MAHSGKDTMGTKALRGVELRTGFGWEITAQKIPKGQTKLHSGQRQEYQARLCTYAGIGKTKALEVLVL